MNAALPRSKIHTIQVPITDTAALATCALFAVLLRLYHLGYESLWIDEIGQAVIARQPWWQTLLGAAQHRGNAPLDYLVTHLMLYVGHSEFALRLPAALFGVLSALVLHHLGRALFDRATGLIAAFLLAVTPMHIYYSREARFYSLATLLTIVTVFMFWRATGRNDRRGWLLYGVSAALLFCAHYYGLLIVAACGLWLLLFRRTALVSFAAASIGAALLFAPWAYYDLAIVGGGSPNPSPAPFRLPSPLKLGADPLIGVPFAAPSTPATVAAVLPLALAFLAPFVAARTPDRRAPLVLVILIPLLGWPAVLALDVVGHYFYSPRQLLIFTPFLLLAASAALVHITRRRPALRVSAVAMMVLLFVPAIADVYATTHRQDIRGMARYLMVSIEPGDVVLTTIPRVLTYYAPELGPYLLPTRALEAPPDAIHSLASGRVWLILATWNEVEHYRPEQHGGRQVRRTQGIGLFLYP